jgi:mono/diheme cytochrome c family protein
MKGFALGAVAAVGLLVAGTLGYFELGFAAVAADAESPAWESNLMTAAVHASVLRRAESSENPLPNSDATLLAGGKLYMHDCVGCHGAPGRPPSEFGATFSPRVPQFPKVGSQYSQAQLFWVAQHGVRMSGMYPQSPDYSVSELWSLAAFISRIRDLPPSVAKAIEPQASK